MPNNETSIKQVSIKTSVYAMQDTHWSYELVYLPDPAQYKAKLWWFDDWVGYGATWNVYKTSPSFATLEAAEAYALATWVEEL